MEQMTMPQDAVIDYNYEAEGVAEPVKEFRPLIFKDGNAYCVVLGPDPQAGVFGCGASVDDALHDWTQHFKEIASKGGSDEVSRYIIDTLQTSKQEVW